MTMLLDALVIEKFQFRLTVPTLCAGYPSIFRLIMFLTSLNFDKNLYLF